MLPRPPFEVRGSQTFTTVHSSKFDHLHTRRGIYLREPYLDKLCAMT